MTPLGENHTPCAFFAASYGTVSKGLSHAGPRGFSRQFVSTSSFFVRHTLTSALGLGTTAIPATGSHGPPSTEYWPVYTVLSPTG